MPPQRVQEKRPSTHPTPESRTAVLDQLSSISATSASASHVPPSPTTSTRPWNFGTVPIHSPNRTSSPAPQPDTLPPAVAGALRTSGQPLDPTTRRLMERRVGHDFGTVRIHTDTQSAAAAHSLNASAIASGQHILFGAGAYRPQDPRGQGLLAHELVHVAQHRKHAATANRRLLSDRNDIAERQADAMAHSTSPAASWSPAAPSSLLSLAPGTWYRGYGVGVPAAADGAVVHDLGDGVYFSDLPEVAQIYAERRTNVKADQRVITGTVNPNDLGPVIDFRENAHFMEFYNHARAGGPVSEDNYRDLVDGTLKLMGKSFADYAVLIGPEGVLGGTQMCIRTPQTAAAVIDTMVPLPGATPATGPPPAPNPPAEGEENGATAGPSTTPKPATAAPEETTTPTPESTPAAIAAPSPPTAPQAAPSPLTLPSEGVDMPWIGKGGLDSSQLGYRRDAPYFWKQFVAKYPQQMSPQNTQRIASGASPVVDPTWVQYHPQHSGYLNQILEHHHVGQGSRAVPIPEGLHDAYTVFHPQRRTVGTKSGGIRPIPPQPTRAEHQAEIDRHVQKGRIRGPGITPQTTPEATEVPPGSPLAGLPSSERNPVKFGPEPAPRPRAAKPTQSVEPEPAASEPHASIAPNQSVAQAEAEPNQSIAPPTVAEAPAEPQSIARPAPKSAPPPALQSVPEEVPESLPLPPVATPRVTPPAGAESTPEASEITLPPKLSGPSPGSLQAPHAESEIIEELPPVQGPRGGPSTAPGAAPGSEFDGMAVGIGVDFIAAIAQIFIQQWMFEHFAKEVEESNERQIHLALEAGQARFQQLIKDHAYFIHRSQAEGKVVSLAVSLLINYQATDIGTVIISNGVTIQDVQISVSGSPEPVLKKHEPSMAGDMVRGMLGASLVDYEAKLPLKAPKQPEPQPALTGPPAPAEQYTPAPEPPSNAKQSIEPKSKPSPSPAATNTAGPPYTRDQLFNRTQQAIAEAQDLRISSATDAERTASTQELWKLIQSIEYYQQHGVRTAENDLTLRDMKRNILQEITTDTDARARGAY